MAADSHGNSSVDARHRAGRLLFYCCCVPRGRLDDGEVHALTPRALIDNALCINESSRIEGTHATARELLLFELEPSAPRESDHLADDWREVFNYRRALEHGTNSPLPLSLRLIREMHAILMRGVRGTEKTPGEFRAIQVAMGEDHRFVPPPPDKVPECLAPFERYLNDESTDTDPLVRSFLAHYQFETIHPFSDGNGRVGRLLLAVMLQRNCHLTQPWLYLSEFFAKRRDEYIQKLFDVSTRSDWEGWIEFCIQGTIEQSGATIDRCQKLVSLREDYRHRLPDVGGKARLGPIADSLFRHPFVRVTDLVERMGITYPAAKADLDRLAAAGIVRRLPDATPITYYAPELFDIAYAGIPGG
jgi:Fic family protein